MANPIPEWLEHQADRTCARQRAQVETGKLIVTFSAAVAATIVATALQVGKISAWDRIAAVLLGATFLVAIVAILFDRLSEVDHLTIMQIGQIHGWPATKLLGELRAASVTAAFANEDVVRAMRVAVMVQVAVSFTTGAAAVISLLAQE
ncbi:hypothetical protein [Micromonospora sp. NBC_01412]|uniref:hypothetical protein n=1 Tax=Micromonospora sp. NBC_01412 TaxID=2903590 RepID=UPI0032471CE8